MRWNALNTVARWRALHWWHGWFAWHPVKVRSPYHPYKLKWVWLETIMRKGDNWHCMSGEGWDLDWSYKLNKKEK